MDLKSSNHKAYQIDQDILDARGVTLTIEEVVSLSTTQFSGRITDLKLGPDDKMFVKNLRRRIKNRMASQNSRRRSMERIRTLSNEISAARNYKKSVLNERDSLMRKKELLTRMCRLMEKHLSHHLQLSGMSRHIEDTRWNLFRDKNIYMGTDIQRRSHGRKQSAPRKVKNESMDQNEDFVLDLKIRKEIDEG